MCVRSHQLISLVVLLVTYLSFCQNGDARSLGDVKPRILDEANDKSKVWKLSEINEPSQCRSLRLPENMRAAKV